ncbi:MAG: formyltransferase family protein, partial [Chloroflexota bacterium]
PPQILQIPTAGCLNVHPSLLPQFRGAAPIFWAFRQGVQETGVSIHWMDEGFDTGDVVAQRPFRLPNGISAAETEWALAQMGGQLLVEVLEQLAANQASATRQLSGGYAAPWPAASDFELDLSWTAQRAYNFMWGTQGWKRPYFIVLNGQNVYVNEALEIISDEKQSRPLVHMGGHTRIQFSDKLLVCR